MTRPHSPRAAARSSVGATGTLVVVLASASMAVFGIVLASLGASLPFIITRFGIETDNGRDSVLNEGPQQVAKNRVEVVPFW